jgi:hypothetical protein
LSSKAITLGDRLIMGRSHQQRTEFCCRILVHVRQDVRVTSIVIDTFTCPEPAR